MKRMKAKKVLLMHQEESWFGWNVQSRWTVGENRVWNSPPYLSSVSSRKELEGQPALEHCWTETIEILKSGFDAVTQDGSPSIRKGRHAALKEQQWFEQHSHGCRRETMMAVWRRPVQGAARGFVAFHGESRQSLSSVSKDKPRVILRALTQRSLVTFRL